MCGYRLRPGLNAAPVDAVAYVTVSTSAVKGRPGQPLSSTAKEPTAGRSNVRMKGCTVLTREATSFTSASVSTSSRPSPMACRRAVHPGRPHVLQPRRHEVLVGLDQGGGLGRGQQDVLPTPVHRDPPWHHPLNGRVPGIQCISIRFPASRRSPDRGPRRSGRGRHGRFRLAGRVGRAGRADPSSPGPRRARLGGWFRRAPVRPRPTAGCRRGCRSRPG